MIYLQYGRIKQKKEQENFMERFNPRIKKIYFTF